MADNAPLPLATGSTRNAATDQVTYSGDTADVQLVRLVDVTGAEGSKTVVNPTFAVTGTFFQATQPVSFTWAGLTDTQLRASAVPVSAASLPLPTGAATETTLAALNTKVTAVNTGAVVLAAGSAIAGKFGIDQTTPGTTNAVALATVGGTNVNASPVGFQRVTDEPRAVFYDPFESLDTADRWTITSAGGGVAPAVAVGRLTLGSGTTINGYAYATSQPTFLPAVPGWLGFSFVIKLESAVGINAVRFWGLGLVSGSVPSSTNPLGTTGNGMGFEVDIAGVLRAVMYSNGVRTVINALASNQPADANDHRYIIAYRTDRTDFYIDGLGSTQLVATASFQSPAIQVLSCLLLAVAHSTAPVASRIIDVAGLAVWDTAKGNTTISDGALPHRKVTVKKPSTAAAATDSPMVVALHPSSPVPQAALTKGTQGATGVTTQDLKDSGRNQSNLFMVAQIVSTATDALQSLTGYKSGAAVTTTTTPAVVTTGKTYRLNRIVIGYVAILTAGSVRVTLRCNTAGLVAITSPAVDNWMVGANAATAGVAETIVIDLPDGIEFAAGSGIGASVQGFNATGTAAATGYALVSLGGYEY